MVSKGSSSVRLERADCRYEATYSRFIVHNKNYVAQQYNQAYLKRLNDMKVQLRKRVEAVWVNQSDVKILDKIIDLETESEKAGVAKECILMGMIYKELKLRGSVRLPHFI